ncbi:MAG: tRNA (adenosine(37)-N6)-threonylcarbamoyltransferase complex ATPase subunit type 1 TsaE [Legionellales bacterium]|nr:tRNA (adenosine(37)-N6)-threonylcarbamoyltransferase complex ATPase subunit type 1 TsaE [Legionellales bacterium]|tara:strand:+ start:752 stop:1198 length:447 start_codon:yes stop_codon:yes gene_type:complete
MKIYLSELEVASFARKMMAYCGSSTVVFLSGDLGAGKTTWVRHCCQALGIDDVVSSPTYSLMNIYRCNDKSVVHLDLYRLGQCDDLSDLCLDDYLTESSCLFVEWHQGHEEYLPQPDIMIDIAISGKSRCYTLNPCSDLLVAFCQSVK